MSMDMCQIMVLYEAENSYELNLGIYDPWKHLVACPTDQSVWNFTLKARQISILELFLCWAPQTIFNGKCDIRGMFSMQNFVRNSIFGVTRPLDDVS